MPGLENGLLSFGVAVLGPGRLLDAFASESLAADPVSAKRLGSLTRLVLYCLFQGE
jgi:hypothetical protein